MTSPDRNEGAAKLVDNAFLTINKNREPYGIGAYIEFVTELKNVQAALKNFSLNFQQLGEVLLGQINIEDIAFKPKETKSSDSNTVEVVDEPVNEADWLYGETPVAGHEVPDELGSLYADEPITTEPKVSVPTVISELGPAYTYSSENLLKDSLLIQTKKVITAFKKAMIDYEMVISDVTKFTSQLEEQVWAKVVQGSGE